MAVIILEHSPLTGALRLGEKLLGYGQHLQVIKLHEGHRLPDDLKEVDGVIAAGGPQSPADDSVPWLADEMALLRAAHEAQLPVVGLCFGCQILGRALGGEVGPLGGGESDESSSTIELGWHEVRLTPASREDPIYAGIAWQSQQLHWHRYQLTELPPGARLLASSKLCRVQAWALGLRTYGFQYHPEVYPETIESWTDDGPQDLAEAGITRDELKRQTEKQYPGFARLADRLFERISLVLMASDRRYAGLTKDLHH